MNQPDINIDKVNNLADTMFNILMGEKPHDVETALMVVIKRVSQDTKLPFESIMRDIQTLHDNLT